jgi:hypothetical protein
MQLAASMGTSLGPSLRRTSAAAAQIALAADVITAGDAASVWTEALKGQRGAVQGKTETGSFLTFVLLLFNAARMLWCRHRKEA